jgi:tetratricopeptide (TPR) repeat protein
VIGHAQPRAIARVVAAAIAAAGAISPATAGTTRATPPVQVVARTPSGPIERDDLPGPQLELATSPGMLALPAIPALELAIGEPGVHAPRALRVAEPGRLAGELAVRGYVTWVYDCATELARANPAMSHAQLAEAIDVDPSLCEPAMFTLGDARTTPRDTSVWIVDAAALPGASPRRRGSAATVAVGDRVTVTGTWAFAARADGDASLIAQAIERAAEPSAPPAAPPPRPAEPEIAVVTELPLRPIVNTAIRNASVEQLNACNRALAAKQYDAALAACRAATDAWADNHLAWYATAAAHLMKRAWASAALAADRAVALRPDLAMYQLYAGMARYEAERARLRADDARPPTGPARLAAARDALRRAIKLAPELWRAHFYLGRIDRDLGDARGAAEQLGRAIALRPAYRPAYVALIALYRQWDELDAAIAVARLGLGQVAAADAAELWFELGVTYDAQRADDRALDELGKAITGAPASASAKLQRAQVHARRGDLAAASRDLDDVLAATDPQATSARPLASRLRAQLTARTQRATGARLRELRRAWRVYRPSVQPYQPWSVEDARLHL